MNKKITLHDLHIPEPCAKNWHEMQGDDKKRFCDFCKKHVHNVTDMPESEFRQLMKANNGKACITIEQKPRQLRFSYLHRPFRQVIAASLLLTGLSGCIPDRARLWQRTTGEPAYVEKPTRQQRLTGDTVYVESPEQQQPVPSKEHKK